MLDPFVGSGVTAVEALKCGRQAVAIDISPVAVFITRMTALPVDLEEYAQAFERVRELVQQRISELFTTTCPKCHQQREVRYTVWEGSQPVEIRYVCPSCAGRGSKLLAKRPDSDDRKLLRRIQNMKIPGWYPKNELRHPDGSPFMKREHIRRIPALYTKRALIALSLILDAINNLPEGPEQDLMRFTFSYGVHRASNMNPDVPEKWGPEWSIPSYWIPARHREYNTWYIFESRYRKVLKGKTPSDANEVPQDVRLAETFDDIRQGRANLLLVCGDALDVLRDLPDNSVDYVFTDPSYGGSIQYGELSFLWAAWLGFDSEYLSSIQADEVIINVEGQHKGFDEYYRMLYVIFREVSRVLKPGRYMTVTFHDPKFKIRNALERACYVAGFDLDKVVYQPPPKIPTKKASMQPYGSVTGDFYFRFRNAKKPDRELQEDEETFRRVVIDATIRVIAERGEPTPMPIISNGIEPELCKHGFPFSRELTVEDVIRGEIGRHFVVLDSNGRAIAKPSDMSNKSIWLVHPEWYLLDRVPLRERVEKAIAGILLRRRKVTFTEVVTELYTTFKNALTPSPASVTAILNQYADKTPDGAWQVKPAVQMREGQHAQVMGILAELGRRAGFDIWIGIRERSAPYKNRLLSELATVTPPLRLPDVPEPAAKRIAQIDVLWIRAGRIEAAFEVENTTSVIEAIVRASNIPYPVRHFCVLPDERENVLYHKLREPMIRDRMRGGDWRFIFYDDLFAFYNSKRRGRVTIDDIYSIAKRPRLRTERQLSVSRFAT